MKVFVTSIIAALSLAAPALAAQPERVTICHAAGLAGTTQYVTLYDLPVNAVYGQAGHFNENGTPNAGHEQDYLGACVDDSTTGETTGTTTGDPGTTDTGTTTGDVKGSTTRTPIFNHLCPRGLTHNPGGKCTPFQFGHGTSSIDPRSGTVEAEEMQGELPHTGFPALWAGLAGLILILAGTWIAYRR